MISMKIEFKDSKTIVYMYNYFLNYEDNEKIKDDIKNIFIKLIKNYQVDLYGYSKVNVYINKKYGSILEIEKIYNSEYNKDIIDLKIIIHKDIHLYLVMEDYLFENEENVIIYGNKYYINIDYIDNINKYIEFGSIIYECPKNIKEEIWNFLKRKLINCYL